MYQIIWNSQARSLLCPHEQKEELLQEQPGCGRTEETVSPSPAAGKQMRIDYSDSAQMCAVNSAADHGRKQMLEEYGSQTINTTNTLIRHSIMTTCIILCRSPLLPKQF